MNMLPLKTLPLSRTLSLEVGILHFVGIGGIGMSGIAEILCNLGYKVQGSDIAENYNVDRLRKQGIEVSIGHAAENLGEAAVVVISSAVKADNPEVVEARKRRIPVVRRAEMLAELMRLKMSVAIAGTHGKTTTTSMIATLFDAAKMEPTVINGGIINAYGTNAKLGKGEWMVVEADESDGTFIRIPSTIAVITNIDPEHLDFYGSFDKVKEAYEAFVQNLPFYGFAVLCADHPEVQALMSRLPDRRIITYGYNPQADVRAVNVRIEKDVQVCDVECSNRATGEKEIIRDMKLPVLGKHNLQNALAAFAVARELSMPTATILKGFASFGGVKRRFTKTGEVNGITVIDDYGHHPVEIAATLSSARQARPKGQGRVVAVVQPHRYTRLRDLFEEFSTCFNDADAVLVSDVYSAGESPIEGIDRDALVKSLLAHGHRDVVAFSGPDELAAKIVEMGKSGDMVVCLGAGSISGWANGLPAKLETLLASAKAG